MKKLAFTFGYIGFIGIFILSAFEFIMMSVNTFPPKTLLDLYAFFTISLFNFAILLATHLNRKHKFVSPNFNLNNRGVAILFLTLSILSMLLLLNSNCYNADDSTFFTKLQGFLSDSYLYIPVIPSIVAGILFVINSSKGRIFYKKKIRVHI